MTRIPELADYTSKYGQDEGWRRWAVSVSKLGYNPSIPSIDWIQESSGMPVGTRSPLGNMMFQFAYPHPATTQSPSTGGASIHPVSDIPTDNLEDATKNLSNSTQHTVPNFIQPYQMPSKGFGAFGERDIF